MSQDSEQKTIDAGQRVGLFLEDEAVKEAFAKLEAKYTADWKSGKTPEDRETAWAKSRALDDLKVELKAVVDSGFVASTVRERRERTSTRRG